MAEPQTPPPLPSSLPVLPLRRTVAFPLTLQPLAVNRPASVESVNTALTSRPHAAAGAAEDRRRGARSAQLESVGTICIVRQMARAEHGLNIIFEGVARVRGQDRQHDRRRRCAPTSSRCRSSSRPASRPRPTNGASASWPSGRSRSRPARRPKCASSCSASRIRCASPTCSARCSTRRRRRSRRSSPPTRCVKKLELVHALLAREVSVLELKGKIESQAQAEMSESQRQYYLRQQLKAIQEQLGEGEASEITELREKVDEGQAARAGEDRRRPRDRSAGPHGRQRHRAKRRSSAPTSTGCSKCRGRSHRRSHRPGGGAAPCSTRTTTTSTR